MPSRGAVPLSVVDGLPMPVLLTRTADDTVVHVNPEFTAAYGHSNGAATGLDARSLHFHEQDRDKTLAAFVGGVLESVEVRLRSTAGECLWAQADTTRFDLDGVDDVLLTTFYDIGERKKAEALVSEMARFPEMNPGPVIRLDVDGTVRRCNNAAGAIFGADLDGKCFWDVCPDFSEEARRRSVEGGDPIHEEVEVGERWLRLTIAHPTDTDQIFVFGTDITSQKAAERELAERARFPQMNPGAVARLTADGVVIRANPAASRLFDREEIRGLSWLELSPAIDDDVWRRVRESGALVQYEADIGVRCYSFTLRHETVSDQVFVYGSDVTELKVAERALAELARFPDMNPGPVCRLDRQGTVLLANPAARAVFDSDDLSGRSWLDLVPGVAGPFWDRLLTTGETSALEARIQGRHYVLTHAPGPEGIFIFVYGSDITREKEAERALRQSEKMATLGTLAAGVAHELNNPAAAVQRAAEQLEQRFASLQAARTAMTAALSPEKAREIAAELDVEARVAATCSCDLDALARSDLEHELEDWLLDHGVEAPWDIAPALVEGDFDLAKLEELSTRVGEEAVGIVATWHASAQQTYRLLDEIRQGAGRLAEIVGAMKNYSYLGQAPVQNVDVNDGLRSTLVILRSKLKGGIVVHQELSSDLPRIEAYGGELNQVWTNLLDNAADAMDGKGEIRLRTMARGRRVVVQVEDNGPGIPEEMQPRVFDAFFTTKAPGKGTGLGLNTSYNVVVEKHGGTIRVDSEPGRTVFTVELPIERPGATSSSGENPMAGSS